MGAVGLIKRKTIQIVSTAYSGPSPAFPRLAQALRGAEGIPLKGLVMKQSLLNFIRDESGAAAAEYALILAIVGAGIAIAAKNLGTAISSAINSAQGNI
jgi:pilus assembly protein Flp/PilA